MSEIADRYARLSDAFDETVSGVDANEWEASTPCQEWTARQLVEHVANNTGLFLGLIGEQAPELPSVSDDPLATWRASDSALREALADPSRADKEFDGFFGQSTLAKSVDQFGSMDLVIHRWDLAHATGQDERIPDEEIERVSTDAKALGDTMRTSGAFGPELDPPADADRQTKLLAFLGREG